MSVFCFYLIFTTPAFHSLLSFSLPDVDLWVVDETSNPVELQVLISASWDGILFWNIFRLVKTLLVHCHFDKINNSMLGVLTCFLVYGKLGGGIWVLSCSILFIHCTVHSTYCWEPTYAPEETVEYSISFLSHQFFGWPALDVNELWIWEIYIFLLLLLQLKVKHFVSTGFQRHRYACSSGFFSKEFFSILPSIQCMHVELIDVEVTGVY